MLHLLTRKLVNHPFFIGTMRNPTTPLCLATAYKNGKQQEKAKIAFTKAADAQSKSNLYVPRLFSNFLTTTKFCLGRLHSAGKNYENAGDIAVALKQVKEAVQLYQNAAHMFSANGTIERAGDSLAKAAKYCPQLLACVLYLLMCISLRALEPDDPEASLKLYLETVESYESEEIGMRKAVETIRKAVNLMLLQNRWVNCLYSGMCY